MNGVLKGTVSTPSCAAATVPASQENMARALCLASSALPAGAPARLTQRCGATGMRGKEWVLTFPARWRGRVDPLTGWWGGGDPLTQLTLRFPSRRAAEEYARREGISLEVCGASRVTDGCQGAAAFAPAKGVAVPADPSLPWSSAGRASVPAMAEAVSEPGNDPGEVNIDLPLVSPAAIFADPAAVVADPRLTLAQKHEILARWKYHARLIEAAQARGMPETGEPSLLAEVLVAPHAPRAGEATGPVRGATPRGAATPPRVRPDLRRTA